MKHSSKHIFSYQIVDKENLVLKLEFIDKFVTVKFLKNLWTRCAFDQNITTEYGDIFWNMDICFHGETIYNNEGEFYFETISSQPISRTISALEYASYSFTTKQAVFNRIKRNALPSNVKAQLVNKAFLIKIN